MVAMILEDRGVVGGIDSSLIRAYAIAPPRVLSLDLAKKYAPNIYSVIYQASVTLPFFDPSRLMSM